MTIPIYSIYICVCLGGLATTTDLSSKSGSLIVWDNASNEDLHNYSMLVCQRLDYPTLPDSVVYCTNPSCQNHQQTLDSYCNAVCECLIHFAKDCIPVHLYAGLLVDEMI